MEISAIIGKIIKPDGEIMAMAQLVNAPPFNFSAVFVAAACVTLYETYLHSVPESDQNKFEGEFKELFEQLFKDRYRYLCRKDEITHD
jgi:hypothetical protein